MKMGSGAPSSVLVSTRNRSEFHQTQDLEISQFWSITILARGKKCGCLKIPQDRKGTCSVLSQSWECSLRAWPRDL